MGKIVNTSGSGRHMNDALIARYEVRTSRFLLGNPAGRALAARIYDVKVDKAWKRAAPPSALIGRIYPQPLTIIQGKDDRVFSLQEAKSLYKLARGNARFKSFGDFGHADEGYDHELFAYLKSVLEEDFAGARPPGRKSYRRFKR